VTRAADTSIEVFRTSVPTAVLGAGAHESTSAGTPHHGCTRAVLGYPTHRSETHNAPTERCRTSAAREERSGPAVPDVPAVASDGQGAHHWASGPCRSRRRKGPARAKMAEYVHGPPHRPSAKPSDLEPAPMRAAFRGPVSHRRRTQAVSHPNASRPRLTLVRSCPGDPGDGLTTVVAGAWRADRAQPERLLKDFRGIRKMAALKLNPFPFKSDVPQLLGKSQLFRRASRLPTPSAW
jgi:hypothetical protein